MPANYVLLGRFELSQSAASVTFSNIPQTGYTDLNIVVSARLNDAINSAVMTFNGSTTGYSSKLFYPDGSSAGSSSGGSTGIAMYVNPSSYTANTFSNNEFIIPNYTSSDYKSIHSESTAENNGNSAMWLSSGLWSNTAAITSVTITASSSLNFVQHSTFSIYGLAATGTTPLIAPKASGGDIIDNDGTYWYHAFLRSNTFIPKTAITCDYIVVAGGGGGGLAGGGGAGGLRGITSSSLTTQNYSVTIGAGGASIASNVRGNSGTSSSFNSTSATGGGGGAGAESAGNITGGSGGSGGGGGTSGAGPGGSVEAGGTGNAGGYSPVEGYAGGSGDGGDQTMGGGGGGGASAAGGNGSAPDLGSSVSGNGGNGSSAYSTWGSVTKTGQNVSGTYYYAGGGAGGRYRLSSGAGTTGTAGLGGGGNGGGANIDGSAGSANTGGGGGGRGLTNAGNLQGSSYLAGGSGIVIIRYAM